MRKFVIFLSAISILLLGAAVVAAQDASNASSQVPDDLAQWIVDNQVGVLGGTTFPGCGPRGGAGDAPRINFNSNGWGNGYRLDVSNQEFVIGGQGVGGTCRIPVSAFPGAAQIVMDEVCGLRANGTLPRVNTSRNNWGNGSRIVDRGNAKHNPGVSLKISGSGVGGHCFLSDPAEAAIAYPLIPKFGGAAFPGF